MHSLTNNLNFFLKSQQQKRITLFFFTKTWITPSLKYKYKYKDMPQTYLCFFLRVYLKKIQKKEKNIIIENNFNNFTFDLINFYKHQNISWGVLFIYSLFFWNINFNYSNNIFKKKNKSIRNNYNSVESVNKQNQPSINKYFINNYKYLKKSATFKFAQPTLNYLIQKKTQIHFYQRNTFKDEFVIRTIMHFIFGNYIYFLNFSKKAKSTKGTPGIKFDINKTSKIIYAANQFTLNTLLKY